MCKRIFASQTSETGEVPFYKIGTLGGIPDAYISKKLFNEYKQNYRFPKAGEILISCSGTIGRCIQYDGKDAYFQDSNIVWLVNDQTKITNEFLFYLISRYDWNFLNTSTIKRLFTKDLNNLKIYYPKNQHEQIFISNFISILTSKIKNIESKINILKKYKEGIMIKWYQSVKNQPISLSKLVKSKTILLGRGEIIPKQNGTFPVYSSSATNNGLFCFRNKYSFNEELITWSIDGGGKPFLRNKHKFSITNVCGYAKILDLSRFSYSWLYINFWNSWRKIKFDYTAKAHPSVIEKLYKIKPLDIESQMKVEKILTYVNYKIDYLIKELNDATLIKESMLRLLFI